MSVGDVHYRRCSRAVSVTTNKLGDVQTGVAVNNLGDVQTGVAVSKTLASSILQACA